jgi:hypothetical protein
VSLLLHSMAATWYMPSASYVIAGATSQASQTLEKLNIIPTPLGSKGRAGAVVSGNARVPEAVKR